MSRLTNRAWTILRAEVEKCTQNNSLAEQVQRKIVLRRLEKLLTQSGSFATLEELREAVVDIFPNFSEKQLKAAAQANRPPGPLPKIAWLSGAFASAAGIIWLVNLPYPMIRRPVARTAPILLLPSYIKMDHNYRGAIAKVEQADQLVNKATSAADFELGEVKVKEAQKNLDALPVWFLGYEPEFYCRWFGCSWRFTLDEFHAARANIGRMSAQIFQEKNALTQLQQAQEAIEQAIQQYQHSSTPTGRQTAIATWQASIDELAQIPSATLAENIAQKKLNTYQRDFQQTVGLVAGSERTNTLISAAKQFAFAAAQTGQNPPYPTAKWEQIEQLWEQAIERLELVPLEEPGYLDAQALLATYKTNLGEIKLRQQFEEESTEAYRTAQTQIQNLQANANSWERNYLISELEGIISELEKNPNRNNSL